ncbi:insulinase family protein [Patescibacteria group bacterium]|nr:insulinase family protein [Patescibacteria group bacterium]MBU1519555.1 insulinase family protein [Patescibacteria group bacterium]MBU2010108.1 insulinase family protein [Patescibacteria group bacterium]MBU2416569.1 insulinase family protein [Patescibacteria group bacterium]MBU2460592.1 insulinase family protein [Patescibacteria group bacterium]
MKYKKTVLKNGLRIVTVPMKDNPTATVLVLAGAGSKYEDKKVNGISHFLEHLFFKGTQKRSTSAIISQEIEGLGAQFNAFTGHEKTGYYVKAQAKYLPKLLDIISDVYINPLFPEKEMEKEKGVIIDEMNMYEDMPMIRVEDLFMELLYGDQPVGRKIIGEKEIIQKMTRADIIKYYNQHYVKESTVVVITGGGFDEKKITKEAEKKFEALSAAKKETKKKVTEKQTQPCIAIKNKQTDQTHILLGARTFGLQSKYKATLSVLAGILGQGMSSRLFQKIRDEMGVGYYVSAANELFTDHGFFAVATGVNNKKVFEVVEVILAELHKTTKELVDEKELKKVKDYLTGNLMLGLESSDAIAGYYGGQEILKKEIIEPATLIKEIQDVTANKVRAIARKIFKNDRLNLALIGPFKDKKPFKKILMFK